MGNLQLREEDLNQRTDNADWLINSSNPVSVCNRQMVESLTHHHKQSRKHFDLYNRLHTIHDFWTTSLENKLQNNLSNESCFCCG